MQKRACQPLYWIARINVHDAYDEWCVGESEITRFISSKLLLFIWWFRVCARLYCFRGRWRGCTQHAYTIADCTVNTVCVCALALLSQTFVHSVPMYILRRTIEMIITYIPFFLSFMHRIQAQKCGENIETIFQCIWCVFALGSLRKPTFDFVVGKWDEIDTMQCAWCVFFFFISRYLCHCTLHAARRRK